MSVPHPDRVAVRFGDVALTYAELDSRANRLAHYLRDKAVGMVLKDYIATPLAAAAVGAVVGKAFGRPARFASIAARALGGTVAANALLRCGAWELLKHPDTPREVVIDEYVELAKAFFDEAEAKFVNAALDGVARDVRG